jgi:DNA repair protein RadD
LLLEDYTQASAREGGLDGHGQAHGRSRDLFSPLPSPKPLRPHQERGLAMLRACLGRGLKRVVVTMPTGAGKTRTAAEIIKGALAKGNRVAFCVPAISLIDQAVGDFEAEGIDAIGVMQASHIRTDRRQPVQVCSIQTLGRRGRPDVTLAIVDECHLQHRAVLDWMRDRPDMVFIGLSATPWAKGMADHWQELVAPVGMADLIAAGFLSPFRVFAPSHPDLSGVKITAGEYQRDQLGEAMSERKLVADIVTTWAEKAQGLPTLVFAVDKPHARTLQEQFASAGIAMGYCDDGVDLIERKLLFQRMARGELAGIVNIGTLTTGVDADVRCVVLARPTRSEMLFVQMIGRALRPAPGKDHALILDHADNHARLGFVTDIRYDRLLTGRDKAKGTRKERGEPMPRECGSCGALKAPKVRACPACGFEPVRQSEIETEDGELIDIGGPAKAPRPPKHDPAAKQLFWSMARFVDLERGKGGKLAKALYRSKFGVWPQGLDPRPTEPDPAFLAYERSRRIAYAKSMGRRSA